MRVSVLLRAYGILVLNFEFVLFNQRHPGAVALQPHVLQLNLPRNLSGSCKPTQFLNQAFKVGKCVAL